MSILLAFVISAIGLAGYAQPSQPAPPQLTCSVNQVAGASAEIGQPVKTSNLKPIRLTAKLVGTEGSLDELRVASDAAATPSAPPTLEVAVTRLSGQTRSPVDVRSIPAGIDIAPNQRSLNLLLEIPIDRSIRRLNIERYLQWLGEESKKTGRGELFMNLTKDHEQAVAALELAYMENMVGEFEVTCRYVSRRPEYWVGSVDSPPVRLEIVFDGTFVDQLKAK